jgi:UDP-glucose 4-epimerase
LTGITKVLVTGGSGFIGSHLVDRLLHDGYDVCVVDNFFSSSIKNLSHIHAHQNFHFIQGDIRDLSVLSEAFNNIDAVFHYAAQRNVAASIRDPRLTHEINVTGTLNVLQKSFELGVKRFIFASSAAVYGTPEKGITEDVRLHPLSPYAVSKVAAEHYIAAYQQLFGLEAICLRYFNVYGPRQETGGAINTFLRQVVNHQSPTIYGKGNQIRDFVHVHDVITANLLALTSNATGIFNIASGESVKILDLAHFIIELSGQALTPRFLPPRPNDPIDGASNIEKARRVLAFEPQMSYREGIPPLFQHFLRNPPT